MAELVTVYKYERALRRERLFKDPIDPLPVNNDHLLRYYRFPRHEILALVDGMRPLLPTRFCNR